MRPICIDLANRKFLPMPLSREWIDLLDSTINLFEFVITFDFSIKSTWLTSRKVGRKSLLGKKVGFFLIRHLTLHLTLTRSATIRFLADHLMAAEKSIFTRNRLVRKLLLLHSSPDSGGNINDATILNTAFIKQRSLFNESGYWIFIDRHWILPESSRIAMRAPDARKNLRGFIIKITFIPFTSIWALLGLVCLCVWTLSWSELVKGGYFALQKARFFHWELVSARECLNWGLKYERESERDRAMLRLTKN